MPIGIAEGLLAVAIGWYMVIRATWSPRDVMDVAHERDMEDTGIYTPALTSRVVHMGQGLPGYVGPPAYRNMGRHVDTALDRVRTASLHTANSRRHLYLQSAAGHGAGGGFSNTVAGTQPDVVPNHKTYTTALPGTSLPGVNPGF
jgi:hypothetical protein